MEIVLYVLRNLESEFPYESMFAARCYERWLAAIWV